MNTRLQLLLTAAAIGWLVSAPRIAEAATLDDPITTAFADYVEAEYGDVNYPACSTWGTDLVFCYSVTNLTTMQVAAGFGSVDDDDEWIFTSAVYDEIVGPSDTLVSETVSFIGLDPLLVGRAYLYVQDHNPDAPDPDYLVWNAATQCDERFTTDDEFLVFLSMGNDASRDVYRSVCPERVADVGF